MPNATAATPSEPPTLEAEAARTWRVLASFRDGAPFWLLLRNARLPAGSVRRALRFLTATGCVTAEFSKREIRYRVRIR